MTIRIAIEYEVYYSSAMARSVLTVRLEDMTRRRLAAAARRRARTPSALVRAAIEMWLGAEEGSAAGPGAYEAIADLVGSVRGGDPMRAVRGPRRISADLRARRRAARR
jgi:predicted transcriptional regulator